MTTLNNVPSESYGVIQHAQTQSAYDEAVEQVRNIGYAIIHSGLSASELLHFSDEFNHTQKNYIEIHGESKLRHLNEIHTIRSPLTHGGEAFLRLSLNENLLFILKKLIGGKFILNQQNGIINPPREAYNQGAWHRDLPYQHFVSTSPLAINALFCVDDFTFENGATFVLPASHKSACFPSSNYIKKNAIQIEAKAGSFILLDCMLFHAGGFNSTSAVRRGVNHVYSIPFFKQQINIPMNVKNVILSAEEKDILGFNDIEPASIVDYLSTRKRSEY